MLAVRDDVLAKRRVVFASDEVTVIDTALDDDDDDDDDDYGDGQAFVRSLHLAGRPALVQSSLVHRPRRSHSPSAVLWPSSPTGALSLAEPPQGPHLQGLALAVAVVAASRAACTASKTSTGASTTSSTSTITNSTTSTITSTSATISSSGSGGGVGSAGGLRVAVLGAGGCALPLFLAGLVHRHSSDGGQGAAPVVASVAAVEASAAVVDAARRFFLPLTPTAITATAPTATATGAAAEPAEPAESAESAESAEPAAPGPSSRSRLALEEATAQDWVARRVNTIMERSGRGGSGGGGGDGDDNDGLLDLVVVDIEDGSWARPGCDSSQGRSGDSGGSGGVGASELVAPPRWVLEAASEDGFLPGVARLLAPGGALAVHVVGSPRAQALVAASLRASPLSLVHAAWDPDGDSDGDHSSGYGDDSGGGHPGGPSGVGGGGREAVFFAQRPTEGLGAAGLAGLEGAAAGAATAEEGARTALAAALSSLPPLVKDAEGWVKGLSRLV